jgi:serpin B
MNARALVLCLVVAACDKPPTPASEPVSSASGEIVVTPPPPPGRGAPLPMPNNAASLAKQSNAFGLDLWAKQRRGVNFAMSPASITMALAMAYGGARGTTALTMKKTMHLDAEPDAAMESWGKLERATQSAPELDLRIANRLFGEKTFAFEHAYVDKTRSAFSSPLEPVDFAGSAEPSRARVNAWVSEQTNDRIPEILPPGSITPATHLVLVNAVWFLAEWSDPFDRRIEEAPFWVSPGHKKTVPTMVNVGPYRMTRDAGATILQLAYKAGRLAMVLAIPDRIDGLALLERRTTPAKIASWSDDLRVATVRLKMPKVKIQGSPVDLSGDLTKLGMDVSDLSGIAKDVSLDAVYHATFVQVDENGTEASAATVAGGGPMAAPGGTAKLPEPLEVRVDRPFLFFIVDRPSGLVLFMGRVVDPSG